MRRHDRRGIVTPDGAVLSVHTHAHPDLAPDAPTLVLAHGWAVNHESWLPVVEELADEPVRVVLWDQRGHGRSTIGLRRAEMGSLSVEHTGRDLDTVLRTVVPAASPVVLAGHSMGGMTVMALAEQRPDLFGTRVRAALLVATASSGVALGERTGEAAVMRMAARGLPLPPGGNGRIRALVGGLFGENPDPAAVETARAQVAATKLATFGAFYGALLTADQSAGFLGLERVRVGIVAGRLDPLMPVARAHALRVALPHATFTELPHAGHMLPWEATDVVADEVRDLLAEMRARRASA
ncbi:alpha/beta hydrolase [Intrasporangium sp. YIM S08009]|uniref:alpha/beta fold hydrolase n=1 Tax=Intrasporangium zincisolvens TaxID=3080018 RepID=UPI002B057148|nr:alpha/beta hydrolase [Intrasporangium sp. YIM S08009]